MDEGLMKPEDLIGPKRVFAPVKEWFSAWSNGTPSVYPLVIVGDSGVGKTTVAHTLAESAGFTISESHAEDDRNTKHFTTLFSDARKPSFFGNRRCVIIEDIEVLGSREWAAIEKEVKQRAVPLVIIASSDRDVRWSIRRNALVHLIPRPSTADLKVALSKSIDDEDQVEWIAENSGTWRSAFNLAATIPPDFMDDSIEILTPLRTGHSEIEAILAGEPVEEVASHPLAVITAAEWNGADPRTVVEAIRLNSMAWSVEGLSEVATRYLATLRAPTADRPPFRRREIRGSVRHV